MLNSIILPMDNSLQPAVVVVDPAAPLDGAPLEAVVVAAAAVVESSGSCSDLSFWITVILSWRNC